MAILGLFEATISVNGNALQEYDVVDDEAELANKRDSRNATKAEQVIKRYIEAREGQHFKINFSVEKGYKVRKKSNSLIWDIYLDGSYIVGALIAQENYDSRARYEDSRDAVPTGSVRSWQQQRFIFSSLYISQETPIGNIDQMKRKYDAKGTIEICVWRYRGKNSCQGNIQEFSKSEESVPEKALKGRAVTLGAGLDEPEKGRAANVWDGNRVGERPLAVFVFEYRSRKSLQDLMIIERPRSLTPLEDRDPDTLTEEEMRQLIRQQKAEKETLQKQIKQEDSTSAKRERQTSPFDDDEIQEVRKPKTTHKPAEVIELDSD